MKLFQQNISWHPRQLKNEVYIKMMVNTFKNYMILWEYKKLKIIKWETINITKKLIEEKEKLRSPLNLDEKVLLLAERLKKKDAPGNLYKASTDNMLFFNRDRIFTIYKRAKLNNGEYLFWVEEDGKKINGRFLRQELFALNNQFLRWDLF